MYNPFLAEVEPHAVPQYGGTAAVASNPFLSNEIFSYEPPPVQPTQGENPFLVSMSSEVATAVPVSSGNPFADFVVPQTVGYGYIGATETMVNSWSDMHTSYGSSSELELQQAVPTATQDLLSTVTGALEATSSSLLDRLRYAQPSPVALPPSPTPSPRTPSPDLLMGEEDLTPILHPFMQTNAPHTSFENATTIDLMGLYGTPQHAAAPQQFIPEVKAAQPLPDEESPPAQTQAIENILDLDMNTAAEESAQMPQALVETEVKAAVIEVIRPIETAPLKLDVRHPDRPPPARPTQPPKASPSRPPPPVPPSPRKELPQAPAPVVPPQPTPEPIPESQHAFVELYYPPPTYVLPFAAPVSAFDSPVGRPDPVSPFAAEVAQPIPVSAFAVAQPVPQRTPTSPFRAYDTCATSIVVGRGPPPVPPAPQAQPVTNNAPDNAFDVFEDRFQSAADGDAIGDQHAFGGCNTDYGGFSAWGDAETKSGGGLDNPSSGFGEDKFDEFLSLREPPPVPQSTPAKSRLNSGSDDFDKLDTNISVTIRQKDKLDFNLDLVPSLAPPPKSPAISTGSAFSEDNSSFVPFLSSVKPTLTTGDGSAAVPRSDSQDSPQTPLFEEDQSQPLEDFPRIKYSGDGWEMHMRHPNKKKITGQRFWKKVYVRMASQNETPTVQIFNSAKDKDPIQEIPLQPCYSVSDIAAQQFDQFGKIFTVKLQYIFYKERPGVRPGQITKAERITNKLSQFAAYAIQGDYQGVKEFGSDLKKLGLPLEHAPQLSQLVKLGTQNFEEMKQFSMVIEESLFHLSVHRDRALTYKSEEVQVTLVDEYYIEQDAFGSVTRQIARVRLYFLSFLSGSAEVELGINDIRRQGKEVVGRHDIIPIATEEWIRIEDIEFSTCVQLDVFNVTKMVKFKPPDACYIELLRFRVRPPKHRELPLQVKTVFTTTGHRIEIRCDILVPGFTSRKLGQIPCEDVMIRIPIPECWIYMFRVEKHFRYGSVKSAHRRSGKVKGIERFLGAVEAVENSLMEVTSGQAKYEHQHKAIVWRVSRLPKEGQGAYTTHSFFCHITLQPHEEIPANLTKHCYVEFTMPHTTISHTVCRSVSVPMCEEPPEKCVKYLSRHEYLVEVEHTQGVAPATYNLAATVVKEEEEVKPELPMEGKALSDSDFSDDE